MATGRVQDPIYFFLFFIFKKYIFIININNKYDYI